MASAIDATVGGANANSYATMEEAVTYFGDRLHKDAWVDAGASDKAAALIWAAKILDTRIKWKGQKTNQTQALDWPRAYVEDMDSHPIPAGTVYQTSVLYIDGTIVPGFVKQAQFELALALLEGDRTKDADTDGISSVSLGSMAISYFGGGKKSDATLPKPVRELLQHYGTFDNGSGTRTLKVSRS